MGKQSFLAGLLLIITFSFLSCDKEGGISEAIFYGKWKASYGDTILFARVNGKNMVNYDISLSPGPPPTAARDFEYAYRVNKLGIKDGFSGLGDFRFYQTFRWLEEGKAFEIQGVEWFPFISSTSTYFTFTKIP